MSYYAILAFADESEFVKKDGVPLLFKTHKKAVKFLNSLGRAADLIEDIIEVEISGIYEDKIVAAPVRPEKSKKGKKGKGKKKDEEEVAVDDDGVEDAEFFTLVYPARPESGQPHKFYANAGTGLTNRVEVAIRYDSVERARSLLPTYECFYNKEEETHNPLTICKVDLKSGQRPVLQFLD